MESAARGGAGGSRDPAAAGGRSHPRAGARRRGRNRPPPGGTDGRAGATVLAEHREPGGRRLRGRAAGAGRQGPQIMREVQPQSLQKARLKITVLHQAAEMGGPGGFQPASCAERHRWHGVGRLKKVGGNSRKDSAQPLESFLSSNFTGSQTASPDLGRAALQPPANSLLPGWVRAQLIWGERSAGHLPTPGLPSSSCRGGCSIIHFPGCFCAIEALPSTLFEFFFVSSKIHFPCQTNISGVTPESLYSEQKRKRQLFHQGMAVISSLQNIFTSPIELGNHRFSNTPAGRILRHQKRTAF